jgi:hypothetical protein
VERLDSIKLKNAISKANGHAAKPLQPQSPPVYSPQAQSPRVYSPQVQSPQAQSPQVHSPQLRAQQQQREFQPVTAITTNWEPFDLLSSMPSTSSSTITTTMASSTTSRTAVPVAPLAPKFDWELF